MQTKGMPEIRKTIILHASIEKVWKAVATSEGIAAWWMPNTFEPVLGHEFILRAGPFGDSPCKVTELDPPDRVGFDWGTDWHLVFELREVEEGKAEFTLIHSGWDADKVTEFGQPHSVVRGIMDGGWEKIVNEKLPADKEMPIAAMTECFPLSRTAVNKHLHVLLDAGLVSSRRVGRETRYRLQPAPLVELAHWLSFFEQYWDDKLSALQEYVESDDE